MTLPEVERSIDELSSRLRSLGIKRVGIFGSTVRGDARPDSDVDLLLVFEPGKKSFDSFMEAADLIEESFTVHVDVLTPEAFDDRRRARIVAEAIFHEIGA